MKISTTWSQDDWNKALKKVWELSRNFEEILEFGLEHGFITSSDIIHASDIYKDPNKIYEDFEIDDFIKSVPFSDLMKSIQDEYSLDDILFELPKHEILDNLDKDDLLDKLNGSWELEQHDEEVKNNYYSEIYDEIIKEIEEKEIDKINEVENYSPDELHQFICNILGIGYYDQNGLKEGINKLKEKLNNNTYNINYGKDLY